MPAAPGLHRFYWDMHIEPLKNVDAEYPMTAVFQKTAPQPTGPWVVPGDYSVVLTVGGKNFTQLLTVKMDPRVKASSADLAKQFELSKALYDTRATLEPIGKSFESLVAELAKAKEKAGDTPVKEKIEALNKKLQEFADPARVRAGQSLELDVLSKVKKLFGDLQEADAAPTAATEVAAITIQRDASSVVERWRAMPQEVASLNAALETLGIEKIKIP
ncbi:MAG: hypothetical protein DME70_10505 [Verrucomicrobia bacterium]|nr:MAG: hypothetical protein DME70_10505 [Verrucomicrobiota bacterium]